MNINIAELRTTQQLAQRLPDIIAYFDTELIDAESRLLIKGKSAGAALAEQTAWPIRYRFLKAEMDKLVKHITTLEESIRGKLYRNLTTGSNRDWSEKGKERYIDNMDEYLDIHVLLLEVAEIRDKYQAVCDAFELRGFALRDMTKLKEIQQYDATI
jgi:hypothetical protein